MAAIEQATGPVVKAESAVGGLMPGLAAIVHTGNGRYFVKAAPADSPAAQLYDREIAANNNLPDSLPRPRMRYSSRASGWLVMVFDFLEARDADLSPGSPDLDRVLGALAVVSTAAAWDAAPPVSANLAALKDKASVLLARYPSGQPWQMYRAAIEDFDVTGLTGDRLVHYDLHPGNLRVSADGTIAITDWAFACAGAPWVDAAFLPPRLIEAGHSPAAAERLLSRLPGWRAAPESSALALAVLWTMFREYKARYGPETTRSFRGRAARAGRAWVEHLVR